MFIDNVIMPMPNPVDYANISTHKVANRGRGMRITDKVSIPCGKSRQARMTIDDIVLTLAVNQVRNTGELRMVGRHVGRLGSP